MLSRGACSAVERPLVNAHGGAELPNVKSSVAKRSALIGQHKTSISLEDEFWSALKEIAATRKSTVSEILTAIDKTRGAPNLSSAIRLYVLEYYRAKHSSAA